MAKYNFDDNKIIANLKSAEALPDQQWVERTQNRLQALVQGDVTEITSPRTSWRNLFFNFTAVNRRQALMFSGAGILSIALLGGGLLGYNLLTNRVTQTPVTLTAEQQAEILSKMVLNNSTAAIRTPQNSGGAESATLSARNAASGTTADAMVSTMPALPVQQFNYRHTEFSSTPGPKAGACKALGENLTRTRYTAEEYTDKASTSRYKYANYNDNNQLLSYSLSQNTPTGSENYEYRGGQYAIKTAYTYAAPAVLEPKPDDSAEQPTDQPQADWKSYFGENAQIKSTVTENGKTYFVVEYSWQVDCNTPINILMMSSVRAEPKYTNNAVYVSWVDSETYGIYKNFTYLDSVAEANLVDSYVQNVEARDTDFASVADKFKFEFNVPVKTLDTNALSSTPEQEAQRASELVAASKLQALLLDHPTIKVNSISAYDPNPRPAAGWDYYQDRKFYPAGSLGDKLYAEANPAVDASSYINPAFSISAYSSDYNQYLNMDVYKADKTVKQLLDNRYTDYTETAKQDLIWKVDGQNVAVTLYTLKIKQNWNVLREQAAVSDSRLVAPDAMPCEGDDCYTTEKVAAVSFGGAVYLVSFAPDMDAAALSFTALDTKDASELNTLKAKILELYTNNARPQAVDGAVGI